MEEQKNGIFWETDKARNAFVNFSNNTFGVFGDYRCSIEKKLYSLKKGEQEEGGGVIL
jgi:hypothetical protein